MAEVIYAGDAGIFKTCTKCGEAKKPALFYRQKASSLGVESTCIECRKAGNANWYDQNKDSVNSRARIWAAANPDKIRASQALYYETNTQKVSAKNLRWRTENPDKARDNADSWYKNNPDKAKEIWRRKTAVRLSTPRGRLQHAIRGGVHRGLKRGAKSRDSTFQLLGYSIEDLQRHLESLFLDGMTWDNYGAEWHVDHVLPLASFSFETPQCEGFRRAWSLQNLQPLWAKDNLSKGARLDHHTQTAVLSAA